MPDRWKGRVKPDPKGLEDNPYLKKEAEPVAGPKSTPTPLEAKGVWKPGTVTGVSEDYVTIEGIVCVDAEGNVMEQYDSLEVKREPEKEEIRVTRSSTPRYRNWMLTSYDAVRRLQGRSLMERRTVFLPSIALTCNILTALLGRQEDRAVKGVLEQYRSDDIRSQSGIHAQNTLILQSPNALGIVHYPRIREIPDVSDMDRNNYDSFWNRGTQRTEHPFEPRLPTGDMYDVDGLMGGNALRNLTGLPGREPVLRIQEYFGSKMKLHLSHPRLISEWQSVLASNRILPNTIGVYTGLVRRVRLIPQEESE